MDGWEKQKERFFGQQRRVGFRIGSGPLGISGCERYWRLSQSPLNTQKTRNGGIFFMIVSIINKLISNHHNIFIDKI